MSENRCLGGKGVLACGGGAKDLKPPPFSRRCMERGGGNICLKRRMSGENGCWIVSSFLNCFDLIVKKGYMSLKCIRCIHIMFEILT